MMGRGHDLRGLLALVGGVRWWQKAGTPSWRGVNLEGGSAVPHVGEVCSGRLGEGHSMPGDQNM